MVKGLVAVDGVHGPQVNAAAQSLADALAARAVPCGISRWDASGLFGDVVVAPTVDRDVSPRALLLLYAGDLAFRLRWEIAPSLESGLVVIAAPYVSTAVAFGLANDLPTDWLRTLFRFAPTPARAVMLRESGDKRTWKRRPDRGFGECCTMLLEAAPGSFNRKKIRAATYAAFEKAAGKRGLMRKKEIAALAEAFDGRGEPAPTPPAP